MAIVVSHIGTDFSALCAQALRQVPLADVVELRLDRIGNPGREALAEFVAQCPKPVLVTCAGAEGYGEFSGSHEERLEILRTAAGAGVNFVDVPWQLSIMLGELEGKCHRIVSRHDTDGVPADDELELRLEEVRNELYEGDLIKYVTHAHSTEDGLRMLRFVRRVGGGMIGFCAGEAGSFTRLLAPIFGSPFTYAAPAEIPGQPEPEAAAPGQWKVSDLRAAMPPGGVTQETAILGVVGNPIAQSLSPHVLGMVLKAARLDAVYVAFEPESLGSMLELCDDENYRGFSVTAPFKREAFELCKNTDSISGRAGACNTLLRDGEHWRGANTDAPAAADALERGLQFRARGGTGPDKLKHARVLILGTGGAARAVAAALRDRESTAILCGRDLERSRALADEFGFEALGQDQLAELEYDALVHTTPLGSMAAPGQMPLAIELLRPGTVVLDAVYRPMRTPLLLAARERGCIAIPGGEWFVRQASEQLRLFTHSDPDDAILRASFEQAVLQDSQ